MPEFEQEPIVEITAPNTPTITPYILSPISSETSISHGSDVDIDYDWNSIFPYGNIQVPLEPTIREILIHAADTRELDTVTKIQLKVISLDTSLQHMSVHLPLLRELILDGSAISSLRDLGCGLKNLKILKVSFCGLATLDGMLGLGTLEEFHAENNHIVDLSPCGFLPNIRMINLRRNRLSDVIAVTFLTICEQLEHLILSENVAITEAVSYRQIVKSILPNLKTLDEVDISLEETLPEYEKYNQKFFEVAPIDCDEEFDFDEERSEKPTNLCSKVDNKGQFVVSFAPKVLSPGFFLENLDTDSTIVSSYKIEDFPSFEEWLHTPDSED